MSKYYLCTYKCRNCGKVAEFLQKRGGKEVRLQCPECGSRNLYPLSPLASMEKIHLKL